MENATTPINARNEHGQLLCSQHDCLGLAYARGLCLRHYHRAKRHHNLPNVSISHRTRNVLLNSPKGDQGVAQFDVQVLRRGFESLRPFGDHRGYDRVLEKSSVFIRVQIKTSFDPCPLGYHRFSGGKNGLKEYVGKIDFLAGYLEPNELWYIIPAGILAFATSNIKVYPDGSPSGTRKYDKYVNAWHLLDDFITQHIGVIPIAQSNQENKNATHKVQ